MQRRPSVVYIRHRRCRRKHLRSAFIFLLLLILILNLNIRLGWAILWAVLFTCGTNKLIDGNWF